MITVLASGQSNMQGYVVGGLASFLPSITVWNNQNQLDNLTNLGTAFVAPDLDANPFVGGCNNLAVHFCNHLSRVTGEDVRLILVTKGNTAMNQWTAGTGAKGPMYARIEAVLAAAGVSSVDILLWHQGENDNGGGNAGTYENKWDQFVTNLQTDGIITPSTPIVLGECATNYVNINPVLNTIAGDDARAGIARISGFPTAGDNIHFLGTSMPEIGLRYLSVLNAIPGTAYSGILAPVSLDGSAVVLRDPDANLKVLAPSGLLDSRRAVAFKATSGTDNVPFSATATWQKVAYDVAVFDTQNTYDPVNARWTPPAGIYALSARFRANYNLEGNVNIGLYKNGGLLTWNFDVGTGSANAPWAELTINTLVEANGQDFFEIFAYATYGSGTHLIRATELWGDFCGYAI